MIKSGLSHRIDLFIKFKITVHFHSEVGDYGFYIWLQGTQIYRRDVTGPTALISFRHSSRGVGERSSSLGLEGRFGSSRHRSGKRCHVSKNESKGEHVSRKGDGPENRALGNSTRKEGRR